MRSIKSIFGVIGALVPIVYCGSLVFYFLDLSGSPREAEMDGLGPTVLGLGTIGLLFCIPLIFKIARIFAHTRPPESDDRNGPGAPTGNGKGGFDADAAIARYLARQSAETNLASSATPASHEGAMPAKRSSFGLRRT